MDIRNPLTRVKIDAIFLVPASGRHGELFGITCFKEFAQMHPVISRPGFFSEYDKFESTLISPGGEFLAEFIAHHPISNNNYGFHTYNFDCSMAKISINTYVIAIFMEINT
jgi:hypothetical protein